MGLTYEQQAIVEHQGDAIAVAVAGSGKTFTLIEYAKKRKNKRILYLAFNRSVKTEAERKFAAAGCSHVIVTTPHALAFKELDVKNQFTLAESNLKTFDAIGRLQVSDPLIGRHAVNLFNMYCSSWKRQVSEIDYLSTVRDPESRHWVENHIELVQQKANQLFCQMASRDDKYPVTHDAYFKLFQLSNPTLPFDIILLDEGQDSSGALLDIFLRQRGTKLIVGDPHQQLYAFRGAVNSLDQVDFPRFHLTTSFRFHQGIAAKGELAISLKALIGKEDPDFCIVGKGEREGRDNSIGIIARSNMALLDDAILTNQHITRKIYFEGGFNNCTYMSEGASLFDMLLLYLGRTDKVKNDFVKLFEDYKEIKQYIKDSDDKDLGMADQIIERHGRDLFDHIRALKESQVKREQADVIFSTVHKSKGLEYGHVELAKDFINGDDLDLLQSIGGDAKQNARRKTLLKKNLVEEINALYVAITRAQYSIDLPFGIAPNSLPERQLHPLRASIENLKLPSWREKAEAEGQGKKSGKGKKTTEVKTRSSQGRIVKTRHPLLVGC